jgi:putative ABC transport system permease protein
VVTLAVGIGATTTAFTLAYSVLVPPLPFPDSDRLVWITTADARSDTRELFFNSNRMSQFPEWQHASSFDQLAAWSGTA